jgi:hypothetical protein
MRRGSKITARVFAGLALLSLCGCALFGGEREIPKSKDYRIVAPKTWHPKKNDDSDVAYQMASGNVVTLNSSCDRISKTSLDILTRQLLLGARQVAVEKREKLEVDGEIGLFSKIRATIEGQAVSLEIFVVSHANCVYDVALMSPQPSISDSDHREFLTFIKSLNYGTSKTPH